MQDRVRFVAPFLVAALGCGAELASMPPDGEDAAGGAAPDGGDAASSSVTTSANASVSSSAVTTSGSGGGAPTDCSAQPLCDDFEGAAVGALPDAAIWTPTYPNCSGTGTVAIYQGVPGSLAGVSLSTLTTDTGLPAGQLPLFDQELVSKGIPAESETDAQRIVTELQVRADECQTIFPPAGCPGSLSNEPVEDAP